MNKLTWNVELNGEHWAKYSKYVFIISQDENIGSWIVTVNDKRLNSRNRLDEAKQLAEKFAEKM